MCCKMEIVKKTLNCHPSRNERGVLKNLVVSTISETGLVFTFFVLKQSVDFSCVYCF